MPTAGRLTAALALAVMAAYVAILTTPLFKEGDIPRFWMMLCVIAGILVGWTVVGGRAGRGYAASVGNGVTGVVAWIFWVLFLNSGNEMIGKSMRRAYDGPIEAVIDVFALMAEYAQQLFSMDVAVALIVGAVGVGFFSEFFAKRFP